MPDCLDTFYQEMKLRTESYLYLLTLSFLYYGHLTIDAEVRFIWTHLSSFSSQMFLLNRYFSFGGNIIILLSTFFALANASAVSLRRVRIDAYLGPCRGTYEFLAYLIKAVLLAG
ncbi:hypothetical protein GYMLUDRAFT_950718 [Collybiopsis luxurians FD-317 M1]|nr:hypothetical protein GYMLUDRAFT_950718 [Collybiopsis luxurians FD-317 M1]